MAEAPSGDDILRPEDAIKVLEELVEAQNRSRFLGLELNVPEQVVEDIQTKYPDPKDRLYYVLMEYLKQMQPTWRAIVAALRSPTVNLPQLAKEVEAAHFPNSTSIRPEPSNVIPTAPKNDNNISPQTTISEQEYQFVEQPSQDFFCPVTCDLLLQPHLTACCGKHLSQYAATKIKDAGDPCPMCNKPTLSTMLDRHFLRLLYGHHVFCHNKNRGCGWQGEIYDFKDHDKSCPKKNAPLLEQKTQSPVQPTGHTRTKSTSHSTQQLTLECRKMREALHSMYRGSATSNNEYAYFTSSGSTSIHRYEWSTEFWLQLPSSPYRDTGLVIIDGELTTVGGRDNFLCTNRLLTLRQNQWVEEYPHMKIARSQAAVANTSDGNYIAVIGGHVGGDWNTTVELFKVQSREWYELTNLPQPLPYPSTAICGNQLYVIGKGRNGYSCSIQCQTSTDKQMQSNSETWTHLPYLPVSHSTIGSLSRQPVIVGGWRRVHSIYQLIDEDWVRIGSISDDRRMCLVANASPEKMLIVGGLRGLIFGGYRIKNVDECVVIQ